MRLSHRSFVTGAVAATITLVVSCQKSEADKAEAPDRNAASRPIVASEATPRLKAGLWTMTMGDEAPGGVSRMCLDDAVQAKMSVIGTQQSAGACQQSVVTPKVGGGYSFRTLCDATAMGGGRTVNEGEITGDLKTRYVSRSTVTTEGAPLAQMNRAVTVTAEGTYAGPCPADMKPGDLEIEGGMRFNMAEMAEQAAKMAPPTPAR